MKPCLVDVNVWLALLASGHEHHNHARQWFGTLAPYEAGLCRVVQLGVIRLLANRSIMGHYALAPEGGWEVTQGLLSDERVVFLPEPEGLDRSFPLF